MPEKSYDRPPHRLRHTGEPALTTRETRLASGGGQSRTIEFPSAEHIAPQRHPPATTAAGRRTGRTGVGVRRPIRQPGRGGRLALGVKTVRVGRALPAHLAPYSPGPYTLGRFVENTLNPDDPKPNPEQTGELEPRRIQFEAADAIAARAEAGGRQFLLADEPGVGKTISAVLGAAAVGDLRGARRVLVVADRPAAITIGHWCRTITALGDGGLDWVVITWDRLEKVTDRPWDVIIADEAHALRRTTDEAVEALGPDLGARDSRTTEAPFVIATTATPGHTPLELPYLAPAYAQVLGEPMPDWTSRDPGRLARSPAALERHGVGVEHGTPRRRPGPPTRRDAQQTSSSCAAGSPTSGRRRMLHRAAPWGPVPISGMPVALTPARADRLRGRVGRVLP